MSLSTEEKVRQRIRVSDSGCWIWTGKIGNNGYGYFKYEGREWLTHRLAYTFWVGEIPEGLVLDHLCRVTACCNPAHLEPVTNRENIARSPHANQHRTHCPYGHPYEGENLYVDPTTGWRKCIICVRRHRREFTESRRTSV